MSANTFGRLFQIHSFGESHGNALGVVIDGCPAGVRFDESILTRELKRRRPGMWDPKQVVSARKEEDVPEVLSGAYEGKTLGTPIAILVRNQDARSKDYEAVAKAPRQGHADQVWKQKFGHVDHRGGGRSSGRETVARVMGGAVAQMLLRQMEPRLRIRACTSQIGEHSLLSEDLEKFVSSNGNADEYAARFPQESGLDIVAFLEEARSGGESYGGFATLIIENCPAGLGQPVFNKLKSDLAAALMSIGAVSSVELGSGDVSLKGSAFHGRASASGLFSSYGGISGGISNGDLIVFKVGFKPTSSILDVAKQGRHDPCIIPRAIPVLEAMANLVLADQLLWSRLDRVQLD